MSQESPTAQAELPLVLESVSCTYRAGSTTVKALTDVSLAFAASTLTAIVGPSGSGKSTLLLCAAGLERPGSGRVLVQNQDVAKMRGRARNRMRREQMAFVFQEYNLVPALTAEMNIRLPGLFARRRLSNAAVAQALDSVGVGELARRRPTQMSGGQQQRVAIARALAVRPALLFADEPTGALDSENGARVVQLLRQLVDESGVSVLLVTHNPAVAAAADRVVFLRDGRVWDDTARLEAHVIAQRLADVEQLPPVEVG